MSRETRLLKPFNLIPEEIEQLDGYASTNFRIKSEGTNYLLKHYLEPKEYDLIREEVRILKLLSEKNLPFQLPYSLNEMHIYEDGSFSRLLTFIEGNLLSSTELTSYLLENFGETVGLLSAALLGAESDSIKSRELVWDMKNTLLNIEKVVHINDPNDRKVVSYYLDLFEHRVVPVQGQLRHSIIHSDLNDNNVIVEDDKIKGIIDFGDIAYSPLIYEVAIALTYIMLSSKDNPFENAKAFLEAYHKVLPLKREEIELLNILIPSRLCVSVCNSAKRKADGDDTEYVLVSEKPAWRLLHKWLTLNPIWIKNFFLSSIDFQTEKLDIQLLKSDREKFIGKSLSTSYNEAIYMTGGAFQYMYDQLGNTYLDAYNNIPHVGHCHPRISRAISEQARKLNTNTRYLYPELVDYAKAITETLPNSLTKIYYVNSGSEASDLAIRMARTHTNRNSIAILENSYHGHTQVGIAISDYKHNGKGGEGKPNNIITLPLPKLYNGIFADGVEYAQNAIDLLSEEIKKGHTPAALIVEPISGCGGQVPIVSNYLKTLRPFLNKHNILLVVDEVQVGFGRLGKYFWGFEMHGIIPDLLIIGKPMGNGHPVAAVVTTTEIANSFATGMEFFTSFGGNPISCAVALEVLNIIRDENLQENANHVGGFIIKGLQELQRRFDCIGDARGEGLFLGIEFSDKEGKPSKEIAVFIQEDLKKRFILVGTDGPYNNVIKIKPPLCFDMTNAQQLLNSIEKSIELAIANDITS